MNKNQPAFPMIQTERGYDPDADKVYPNTYSVGGLTKLEYFAGLAMQSYIAYYGSTYNEDEIAFKAARQAQAMLAESERIQNENKD